MELIRYQKTLDVHKNGIQFTLQGFETADRLSRIIEISLMASGDAIDFPLERIVAMMYVTTPGADEPSINECTIEDNKIIYNVLPITVEGITTMQLKLVETDITGAKRVLAFPKFAVEVGKSNTNDDGEELQTTFSAIEDFIAKSEAAYGSRLKEIELDSECMFRAYYYDGSTYETDILKKLFLNGNVELSKSYAMGGTGVRAGEDSDNSKYYSNVSKSEALNAKAIMEGSEKILEEVKTHGIYTVFKVDFTTGEVEYVSSSHHFNIDTETGELMVFGATGKFEEAVGEKTAAWLNTNKIYISDLQRIAEEHSSKIAELQEITSQTVSIEKGGTGATTKEEALENLGVTTYQIPWNVDKHVGYITPDIMSDNLFVFEPATMANDDSSPEIEKKIFMKNSGQIYFDYYMDVTNYDIKLEELTIKLNSGVLKTYASIEEAYGDRIKTISILLDVKKEDVISIVVKGRRIGGATNPKIYFKAGLRANLETPYTYRTITEGTEYTDDDIEGGQYQ